MTSGLILSFYPTLPPDRESLAKCMEAFQRVYSILKKTDLNLFDFKKQTYNFSHD